MKSSKQSEGFSKERANLYPNLDELPIYNWTQVIKTFDLSYLCKERKEKYNLVLLAEHWEVLMDEFLERFGLSPEAQFAREARIQAGIFKALYIIENKTHYLTHAEIEEQKANFNQEKKEVDLQVSLSRLSRYYGFKIDAKTTTVAEYYTYINEAENGNEQNK